MTGNILSQTGVLLGAIGLYDEKEFYSHSGVEAVALEIVARSFRRDADAYEWVSLNNFYRWRPPSLDQAEPIQGAILSRSMRSSLGELSDQGEIDVIDLLAAALSKPSDYTRPRLEKLGIDADLLRSELLALRKSQIQVIDSAKHPLTDGNPPPWASGWGQDRHGVFVEITINNVVQRLRWCPPGSFLMGSLKDEAERWDHEGRQTEITFAAGFWLFDTAVSQRLWSVVMGENPSHFRGDDLPVESGAMGRCTIILEPD